jgi:EmrB/QacA subfamily drug resistance transporter
MAMTNGLSRRVTDDNVKWFTLVAACFGLFMAILDNLVVNIAMPTISRELDAKTTQLQWLVSAYTITFASLQITAGGLGDRFGRKRWFLIGLALFTATSFVAAFSTSMEMLLVMRFFQGMGAAFIMPLSLSLISAAFPPEERGRAIGIWSAISVSSVALGPIVGGALVEYASWEWVFLINVPIGLVALLVTSSVVRETRDESGTASTDIPGTALITAGIASLTWALIQAGERGWTDPWILAAFATAIIIVPIFIWVELHTEHPMIPMDFFRSKTFSGANIDSFMIAFALTGVAFFLTLYQQNIHGFSAVKTGLALLPMVVMMMVFSPITGTMTNKLGPRRLITFGMLTTGGGMLLLLLTGVDASYYRLLPSFVVLGFGMSFIWAPMTTAVLNSVDPQKSGIASAVNGSMREIGTAFGVALLGTIANRAYKSEFNSSGEIETLRATATEPVHSLIDLIGSGMSFGGQVVSDYAAQFGVTGGVISTLERVSSDAFMVGMDRASIVGGIGLLAAGVISYFLIEDEVVMHPVPGEAEPVVEGELAVGPAD